MAFVPRGVVMFSRIFTWLQATDLADASHCQVAYFLRGVTIFCVKSGRALGCARSLCVVCFDVAPVDVVVAHALAVLRVVVELTSVLAAALGPL